MPTIIPMHRIFRQIAITSGLLCGSHLSAQTALLALNSPPSFGTAMLPPSAAPMIQPVVRPCARPATMMEIDDYTGPFSSLVSGFSAKLERKTVHEPSKKSRLRPCSLTAGEKFKLFFENSTEPV